MPQRRRPLKGMQSLGAPAESEVRTAQLAVEAGCARVIAHGGFAGSTRSCRVELLDRDTFADALTIERKGRHAIARVYLDLNTKEDLARMWSFELKDRVR